MHFEMGCLMNLSDTVTVVKGSGDADERKAGTFRDKDCRGPDFLLSPRYEYWTRITLWRIFLMKWKLRFMERWLKSGKYIPRNLSIPTETLVDGTGGQSGVL